MLTHALRQLPVSLIFDVRQNMTKRRKAIVAVGVILAASILWLFLSRGKSQMYHVTGVVREIYKSESGGIVVGIIPDGRDPQHYSLNVLLALRPTWGSEFEGDQLEIGKRYTLMIFKPKILETPVAWAALKDRK